MLAVAALATMTCLSWDGLEAMGLRRKNFFRSLWVVGLALVLAAAGLYSVVSYGVATRTNEFGIRMAPGADARDVVRIVLSGTAVTVAVGLAAGLVLSFVFDKIAEKWVTESARDPILLAGVTVLLVAVAGLACVAPARRAASVDPMEALRYE